MAEANYASLTQGTQPTVEDGSVILMRLNTITDWNLGRQTSRMAGDRVILFQFIKNFATTKYDLVCSVFFSFNHFVMLNITQLPHTWFNEKLRQL